MSTAPGQEPAQGSTQRVIHFDQHDFNLQPDISVDYAVMERAKNVTLVSAKFGWSDLGAWPAVSNAFVSDANGNTMSASAQIDCIAVDATNIHVLSIAMVKSE